MRIVDERFAGKNVSALVNNLKIAALRGGFPVLSEYNFNDILKAKSMPIDKCVYLLEICNPLIAKKVLSLDTTFGINIPCKIGILENDNGYHIVYVDPESITEDKKNKLVLSNITTSLKNIISGVLS